MTIVSCYHSHNYAMKSSEWHLLVGQTLHIINIVHSWKVNSNDCNNNDSFKSQVVLMANKKALKWVTAVCINYNLSLNQTKLFDIVTLFYIKLL